MEKLRDYHGVPVLSVHSPCLIITQRVWGTDHWAKLKRSAEAARQRTPTSWWCIPPFAGSVSTPRGFVDGVRQLAEETGILFAVENMYPWRTPGGELKAYLPSWDPTETDFADLTLDLSHASTSNQQSLDLARSWGSRLRHVHLTDDTGPVKDEHLLPGSRTCPRTALRAWCRLQLLVAECLRGEAAECRRDAGRDHDRARLDRVVGAGALSGEQQSIIHVNSAAVAMPPAKCSAAAQAR